MLKHDPLTDSEKNVIQAAIHNGYERENKSHVANAFVVGVTCASTNSELLLDPCHETGRLYFPVVIMDECSQITEPLSLLPLTQFGSRRGLLVGDPLQLPPILASGKLEAESGKFGLERTLFERLHDAGVPTIMLRQQYRVRMAILEF